MVTLHWYDRLAAAREDKRPLPILVDFFADG